MWLPVSDVDIMHLSKCASKPKKFGPEVCNVLLTLRAWYSSKVFLQGAPVCILKYDSFDVGLLEAAVKLHDIALRFVEICQSLKGSYFIAARCNREGIISECLDHELVVTFSSGLVKVSFLGLISAC
jgi:hypothetical protein